MIYLITTCEGYLENALEFYANTLEEVDKIIINYLFECVIIGELNEYNISVFNNTHTVVVCEEDWYSFYVIPIKHVGESDDN